MYYNIVYFKLFRISIMVSSQNGHKLKVVKRFSKFKQCF